MTTLKNDNSDQSVSMNREIKFRLYGFPNGDKNKATIVGDDFNYSIRPNGIVCLGGHNGNTIASDEYYKLVQYTGLKDINGIEIYEGDIFEVRLAVLPSNMRARQLVQFSDGMFHSGNMPIYLFDKNSLCIIGNIYQNSELLSEK